MIRHPIYNKLRQLREAAELTLPAAAEQMKVSAAALGSWERGDRRPSLARVDEILHHFGYELRVVAIGAVLLDPAEPAAGLVLTDEQMVAQLRHVAAQLDARRNILAGPKLTELRAELRGQVPV